MRLEIAAVVAVYFLILLAWAGYNFYKNFSKQQGTSAASQYVGTRSFGTLQLLATLIAAYASNYTLLAAAESGFVAGVSGPIWYSIGVALPLLLFVWPINLTKRIREAVPEGVTMVEYIGQRFGERTRVIALFVITVSNVVYIVSIVLAVGIVISTLLSIQLSHAVIAGGLVLLVYTSLGDYSGLVWGHIYQVILATLAIAVALVLTLREAGRSGFNFDLFNSIPPEGLDLFGWGPSNILDFVLGLTAFAIAMPQIWQRIYSAKDSKSITRAMLLFPVCWTPIAVGSGVMGIAASQMLPDINPGEASTRLVMEVFPTWGAVVFMMGALALVFSTGDATVNNIASNVQIDIVNRIRKTPLTPKQNLFTSVITQALLCSFGIIAAINLSGILDLLVLQAAVNIALVFPLYLGLTWKRINGTAAFWSILISIAIQITGLLAGTAPIWNMVTVVASLATILTVSYFTRHKSSEELVEEIR